MFLKHFQYLTRQVTSYNVHPWWWQDADKQYVIITAKLGLHSDPGP